MRLGIRHLGIGLLCLCCGMAYGQAGGDLSKHLLALKDKDPKVRIEAATALGNAGSAAEQAVPALLQCIRDDEHGGVRVTAASALAKFGEKSVPAIVELLKEEDADELAPKKKKGGPREGRPESVFALMAAGALPAEVKVNSAIPAVTALMAGRETDDFVWMNGAKALVRMGPNGMRALQGVCQRQFGPAGEHVVVILRNTRAADANVAALKALGAQGAAAAKAVPILATCLREQDQAVREAAADALARVGSAAVPEVVQMLAQGRVEGIVAGGKDEPQRMAHAAIAVLERMDPQVKVKAVIPALTALLEQQKGYSNARTNAVEALGRMGPEALPALTAAVERGVGIEELAEKIGPAARPAVGRLLEKYAVLPLSNTSIRWEICNALAAIPPGEADIPALLKLLSADEFGMVQDLGMVLERIGPASVPALTGLMAEKDWYPRWGATMALEMMGSKGQAALPTLEKALKDEAEDIDVRVGAARAIAAMKGIDPFELYRQIPGVQERIVRAAKEKSLARRREFMQSEIARVAALDEQSNQARWQRITAWTYSMMLNQDVQAVNAAIKAAAESGDIGNFMDTNMMRVFMLFHSRSPFFPGRLTSETEAAMKKYYFNKLDNAPGTAKAGQARWKVSTKDLKPGEAFARNMHANGPLNYGSRDYLSLSVLKDDPEYKDRKLSAGDTVTERYHAWNEHFKEFLKDWALYGLWMEIGSSYEYHTYSSLFNLADLAPDPVVRQRARMYLDLCMVEAQQITMAGLRGGTKARAKKGGEGSPFNPYLHMLFGERGRLLAHSQIAVSDYQPPEAAVLLHKLGAPVAVFEIANRQAGELDGEMQEKREQRLHLQSHMINYAYRTPEYVMGCSIYDPNRPYAHASEGRWSGVVFRDRAMISLSGYTGEKWNVQSKDVMITQRRAGAYYGGVTKVELTSGFEKMERDGWVFLNNGEAFAAIKVVTGGSRWTDPVKGVLELNDQYSPIILQTGRLADYGSFDRFQEAILKSPLKLEYAASGSKRLHKVTYAGPNTSKVEFCLENNPFVLPTIDGKPVDLEPKYNYRSPYLENQVGSDVVTVRYGERRWDYDFTKNTVTETKP